jgi:mRNA-degrading endonuclease HigB of HigAB toxin-antitoxin module
LAATGKEADWAKPADIKHDTRSASIFRDGRVVFNIAGNKYRIRVWINCPNRVVYMRFVGTHREYDSMRKRFEGNGYGNQAGQEHARLPAGAQGNRRTSAQRLMRAWILLKAL